MAIRRGQGEGSIHRTPDGSGWAARLELPRGPNGKRRVKKRRARTRAEATRALQALRDEYLTTGQVTDSRRLMTECVADYLDHRVAQGISASAQAREERFGRYVTEYFGRRKLVELSVLDIDRFLADASAGIARPDGRAEREPIGRDHMRRLRSFARAALKNDIRRGLISTNVAELAELPEDSTATDSRQALDLESLGLLISNAIGTTRILVDLIGRHGLRPAEARATTWECIDLNRLTLRVKAQVSATNVIADAKTVRSNRVIPLHPDLGQLLGDHRNGADDLDLVAGTRSGAPIDRNNFNRSLRKLCAAVGLEAVKPYELRHTAITHQCQRGYRAWQVADWAGTSEAMIYLYYRHVLTEVIEMPPVDWQA